MAILLGAAFAFGQAPFDFPWTGLVAVPLLLILTHRGGFMAAMGTGWFAGLGYFLVALHWIVEPFLVDAAKTGFMAPFALPLMAGGLALFWAIGFGIARLLPERLFIVGLPALWTLTEIARGTLLTGFPWAMPAYIWMETPIAQALAYIGPYGLTFLTLQVFALPALRPRMPIVPLVLVGGLIGGGYYGLAQRIPANTEFSDTIVRLVQPNAQQDQKWDPDFTPIFWQRQLEATAAPGGVDIVVWPEVAVPFFFDERTDLNQTIARQNPGAQVIYGALHVQRDPDRYYNSAVFLDQTGGIQAYYDKAHLVPFGEYLPFAPLWDRFGLRALAQHAGRFASGTGGTIGSPSTLSRPAPLICYEMIFPDEVRTRAAQADWLVHLTNDAWFGNFSGPYQHLAQAQARAIETGLPVARAANTGISAIIDPYGRIVASLGLGAQGHLDAALPEAARAPFQQISHPLRALMLILVAIFGVVITRLRPVGVKSL